MKKNFMGFLLIGLSMLGSFSAVSAQLDEPKNCPSEADLKDKGDLGGTPGGDSPDASGFESLDANGGSQSKKY